MHRILMVVGFLISAIGFAAIGFGIPDNAFSLGNTLIIAGTTAVVGGFVLVGLASAIGQLKRIADGEGLHLSAMSGHAPGTTAQLADPRSEFMHSQISQGLAPTNAGPSLRSMPEPTVATVAPSAESDPVEWLRPKDREPTMGERAVIEEFEASLAPQPAPPPPPLMPQSPPAPRAATVANTPRMPDARSASGFDAPAQTNVPPRAEPMPRAERASSGLFDSVWPEIRPARNAETVERARRPEDAQTRDTRDGQTSPPIAEESRPVAILKSGMIDGMAYTLFADGSIEAVLATGTLRFASVDALRVHLEKNA